VIAGESEGGNCDKDTVMRTGWGEPGGKWTEWGWRGDVFEDAMAKAKAKARSFPIKATYAYEILHN